MEEQYIVKHYYKAKEFLEEIGPYLHVQEIYNSIFISQLQLEAENNNSQCLFTVVMDPIRDMLIFALMALKDSFLYASGIASSVPQDRYKTIVEYSVKHIISTSFPFASIHSYEPVLDILKEALERCTEKKFKFIDDVWSVQLEKVQWSERSLAIKNSSATELKLATMTDLPLIMKWTEGFLHDISEDEQYAMHPKVEPMCREKIEQRWVYILYKNDIPLTMAWKTRPLIHGCSIAHVYTPEEHRHKGYGATCISILTEQLLQKYKYISLFVAGERDPTKNMYTGIGFQLYGKAARYTFYSST